MHSQKQIELTINNSNVLVPYIVELFHANANRAESYAANHLNAQPGFVSFNFPLLTLEGINEVAVNGNAFGLNYWSNDRLFGITNDGLQYWEIYTKNSFKYSYRALLNYLMSKKIVIGKVKIYGNAVDIKNNWKIRRYFMDGSTYSDDIVLSNMIPPEQVQENILEFDLNKMIDGDTAIEISMNAGALITLVMDFEITK